MKTTNHPVPFKRSPFWIQPGLALVLAWAATTALRAQDHTYSDGEDYSTPLDTGTGITLTVPVGAATQSGSLTGTGSLTVNPTSSDLGKLTLTATSYYGGDTTIDFGTLAVSGDSAYLYNDTANSNHLSVGSTDGDKATLEISSGGKVDVWTMEIGHGAGSQGTATLSGNSGVWATALSVGNSGDGTLTVSNGGYLRALATIKVGEKSGSTGSFTVDDAYVTAGYDLFVVGDGGDGTLAISNGGNVQAGSIQVILGNFSGSMGNLTVSGAGSFISNLGLSVGKGGSGTMTISNGGRVVTYIAGEIGSLPGGTGQVTVDGTGSLWSVSQGLGVSNGTLAVTHGGQVSCSSGTIGNLISSNGVTVKGTGSVTVDGTGSTWRTPLLDVGNGGNGTLTVCNGGQVSSQGTASIGTSGGVGEVKVTGTGSLWTHSGGRNILSVNVGDGGTGTLTVSHGAQVSASPTVFYVGKQSTGTLTISSGGQISSQTGYIGYYNNPTNKLSSATVDGAGSLWAMSDTLYVGYLSGSGTLMISNGGKVSNSAGYIGYYTSSTPSSVTVDGAGSLWTTPFLNVGSSSGSGTLTISHGGKVSSGVGYLGGGYGGTTANNVTVDGTGSTWTISSDVPYLSSDLFVGDSGECTLTISNGGQVSDKNGFAGYNSMGSATVDGADSLWTNSGNLAVGSYAGGTVTISHGGKVSDQNGYVGSGGPGSATVDGAGSLWTNSGDFYVGNAYGDCTVAISNGGRVSDQNGYVGYYSQARVTVTGSGSSWTNSNALYVGGTPDGGSTGTLSISDGGMVTSPVTYLANKTGGQATVNLNPGGILATGQVIAGDGTATLNFDGGTLRATAASTDFLSNFSAGGVTIGSGGATIDNNGYAITVNSALSGTGGITSTGAGTLTLTGSNTYTGGTLVSAGTLAVGNNSALGTGTVKVKGGTLLIQQGFTVANTITLSGGTLAQQTASGSSYAALHAFTGNADGSPVTTAQFLGGQAGGATTVSGDFSLTSGAENDSRRVSEVFHLGGVSVVDAGTGQTDIFVLQLQLAPSLVDSTSYLGWLDPETNLWTNAVDGNFGGTSTFIEGAYDPATDFQLGTYGIDTTTGTVWAVLDHNSSFAVVPEPSTWLLLGLGFAGLLFHRNNLRRKRQT